MPIGENIKQKRLQRQMTLEEVASKLGTSKQTIHRYESGVISNIPSDKIEVIAKILGTTPAFLMGWEESSCNNSSNNNMSNPVISKEALKVAQAYDKADDTKKAIVKLTLGIDEAVKNEMHCEQCEDVG